MRERFPSYRTLRIQDTALRTPLPATAFRSGRRSALDRVAPTEKPVPAFPGLPTKRESETGDRSEVRNHRPWTRKRAPSGDRYGSVRPAPSRSGLHLALIDPSRKDVGRKTVADRNFRPPRHQTYTSPTIDLSIIRYTPFDAPAESDGRTARSAAKRARPATHGRA